MKPSDLILKSAVHFLHNQDIQWKRDWDALFVGFVVGVLVGVILAWRFLCGHG